MSGFSYIESNLSGVKQEIHSHCLKIGRNPDEISLIAVSKTFPPEAVSAAFSTGHIDFGENKVQELCNKHEALSGIEYEKLHWHLIGHLQTNKVKYIVPFVYMVHSLDSVHLAEKIHTEAAKTGRIINCLVQVNTSGEDQKSGIAAEETEMLIGLVSKMENIRILGLMTIGKFIDDYSDESQREIVRGNFRVLKSLYYKIASAYIPNVEMKYLSMGMTSDYDIALEEGSNMLRIGTAIFGERKKIEIN